jgi:hypothetical protein
MPRGKRSVVSMTVLALAGEFDDVTRGIEQDD